MHPTTLTFAKRGPHPVGLIETTIPMRNGPADFAVEPDRQLPTSIWYPAAPESSAREDAPHPLGLRHRATLNLAAATQPCAFVAFSHGNSGLRQQSTFLMTQLASWGFVVAAADHVGNTFSEMMALPDEAARISQHRRIRSLRPYDLHSVVQTILDEGHRSNNLPPLDAERVGLLGHSFGGWTILKVAALEPRVRAVCALAPASEPFVGRRAFEPDELPLSKSIDALVLAAENDVLVDLETSIRPLCDRMGPRSSLEIIERADHFHFCDGIEMLHKMHENNPRPNQLQPTRSLEALRGEDEMHALLNGRVTRFFRERLGFTER